MKSSERDSKGRGLPVGFAWEDSANGQRLLFGTIAGERIAVAAAFPNGGWRAGWSSAHNVAQPRPGESAGDAALREAEAALWRCDGYGVGEVRGFRLHCHMLDAAEMIASGKTYALPGLFGMWEITAAHNAGNGNVEVDAVRAPSEPAPQWIGSDPPPLPIPDPPRWERSRGEGNPHPARHLLSINTPGAVGVGAVACPVLGCGGVLGEPCSPVIDGAEPAPSRGPSAPTDADELARLLRGPDGARLDDDIATVRNHAPEIWSGTREHVLRVARACALLLAERERMADTAERSFTIGAGEIDKRRRAERECAALRARVAVLEAGRSRPEVQAIEAVFADEQTLRNWLRLNGHGDALDAGRSGVEVAIALLSAPPPGTVAALLARVEEARRGAATKASNTVGASGANFQDGKAAGLREAASLIRAALTPSPLDGVVAEVCALPPFVGTLAESFDRIGEALDLVGDESTPEGTRRALAKVARVALAGMLACDAAKGGA